MKAYNMRRAAILVAAVVAVLASPVRGQTPGAELSAVEAPAVPAPVQSGEPIEPEVTIVDKGGQTLHEYRVNGELYMIKVMPKNAPPYFLVDTDGDGTLETRHDDMSAGLLIPRWVIYSW